MSHIFISYSRKDLDFAQKIVDALAANDLDTWIDWKSIPKGEDWWDHIQQGIEEADGRKRVIPHWVRAANNRTLRDIHDEIRTTQKAPEHTKEYGVKWLGLLPTFAWNIFFWFIFKNPPWLKKSFGTVGMTSVGMFGKGSGWAIPFGLLI